MSTFWRSYWHFGGRIFSGIVIADINAFIAFIDSEREIMAVRFYCTLPVVECDFYCSTGQRKANGTTTAASKQIGCCDKSVSGVRCYCRCCYSLVQRPVEWKPVTDCCIRESSKKLVCDASISGIGVVVKRFRALCLYGWGDGGI